MADHGGRIVAKALKSRGVDHLFTLSGGHLFSIYDGCKEEGIGLLDVRHEQTAAFAAEGMAKATRRVGVAALTAGPGVTNGLSAIAGAQANCSPVCVLGGRAPEMRWGSGSLQEIDHLPFVSPLVKSARDRQGPGPDRGDDRGGARPGDAGSRRADLPRLSRSTSSSARPRPRCRPRRLPAAAQAGRGRRAGGGAACRRRAPGDHGRQRPLLGAWRGGDAARWPRRSASRSSSTASAAAASPPTTSWPSAALAGPG